MAGWRDYLHENFERYLAELSELVRIPSVSALPEHAADMVRAAEWVAARLTAAGVEHAAVMPTTGHPAVYGDWLHAGEDQPTILLYGHFDVQPADPLEMWDTPPFEATRVDGRLYGRGATDDKGGMLTPIMAVESLLQSEGTLPVNVKFCFEGQEEIGSPDMGAFIEEHAPLFSADLVLSADGMLWSADEPMIVLGFKGLTGLQINVTACSADLHSGLHGGVFFNPIEALAHILASLRSADGKIMVDGFYDDVVELSQEARARIAQVPMDEDGYRQKLGIPRFFGEPGYTVRERNWIRPTLELNGIWGGFQGEGTKTVIPSTAHAKITCRLVSDQDPERIHRLLAAHIEKVSPAGVTVDVERLSASGEPYLMSSDHPGNLAATEVFSEVFGVETPLHVYVGGTLPVVTYFRRYLGADTINFGWSAGDENLHAPNEFVRIRNVRRGAEAFVLMLKQLGN
jgi:acetylornithine deacetylase/succinyl-diaminopimelate desuccinylase-like protein